jgi:DNA-directed RNA polymerase specialized sigma subunit
MEIEKGKTCQYLRGKSEVSQVAKDNLKQFNRIKKSILEALKESDLTIEQITQKIGMPKSEVVYYLMSLVKYGFVQTGSVDYMDEYFTYKIKK